MTLPALEMTGLEQIQALVSGETPAPSMGRLLGFMPVEAEPGRVVFAALPTDEHLNPMGSVHGGFAATLLDSAMGCAVQTMLPAGAQYTTIELSINMVRPLVPGEEIRTIGVALHTGRRMATAEGRIEDARTGKLLAHGTTTCLVVSPS